MSTAKAVLTKKGEKWFRSGHPWIFKDDVLRIDQAENGDIAALYTQQGHFLGWFFYSLYSKITLRFLSSGPEEINRNFWRDSLEKAIRKRQDLITRDRACRLVFSEADHLPGLIADWYAGHLVLQTLIPGTERRQTLILELFQELLQPESILLRNDFEARSLENLPRETSLLAGKTPEKVKVQEGPVQYWVDLIGGQKTGAYLDQRENRIHLESYGHHSGRALDSFCYTGGFSLHLAKNNFEVMAIDDSATALEWARKNAELNGLSQVQFHKANLFDFFKKAEGLGQQFDLIILDPPAFARRKSEISGASRGYLELNRRALRCLRPGGILNTYTCSHNMTEPLFLEILVEASRKAKVKTYLLEKRIQSSDHPILLNFPESHYLKGLILQVE